MGYKEISASYIINRLYVMETKIFLAASVRKQTQLDRSNLLNPIYDWSGNVKLLKGSMKGKSLACEWKS
jgi:hypothetical protein